VLEVCFTGMENTLKGDRTCTAKTYLWMHPIYGATALGLEYLQERLRFLPRLVRALAYTAVIFGAEFTSGWLLRKALGRCPWDYEDKGWSVKGLIRLDYAPFWYTTALLFEPMHEALLLVTREALRHAPGFAPEAPGPLADSSGQGPGDAARPGRAPHEAGPPSFA
jgi:putative ABC transporter type IV